MCLVQTLDTHFVDIADKTSVNMQARLQITVTALFGFARLGLLEQNILN